MASKKAKARKKPANKKGTFPVVPILLVGAGITASVGAVLYFRSGSRPSAGAGSVVPQLSQDQNRSRRQGAQAFAAHQEQWRTGGGLEAYCAKTPDHPRCRNLGYVNFGYPGESVITSATNYASKTGKLYTDKAAGSISDARNYLAERKADAAKQAKLKADQRRREQEREDRMEKALLAFVVLAGVTLPVIVAKSWRK